MLMQHFIFNLMYVLTFDPKPSLNILELSKDGKTYEGGLTCTEWYKYPIHGNV